MYLRFVIGKIDEESHQPQGLFTAAYDLLDDGDLTRAEREAIEELLSWFENNLQSPGKGNPTRAVFWYKETAHTCIRRMWELAVILETQGCYCEIIKCRKLGNIVWQDEQQVKAYPSPADSR